LSVVRKYIYFIKATVKTHKANNLKAEAMLGTIIYGGESRPMTPADREQPEGECYFCETCQRWLIIDGKKMEHFDKDPFPYHYCEKIMECPECNEYLNTLTSVVEHQEKRLHTALDLIELMRKADRRIQMNSEYIVHSANPAKWVTFPNLVVKAVHEMEITILAKNRIKSRLNLIIKEIQK
jgi:hypothetical protein